MKKTSCIYVTARPSDAMIGRKDECHIKLFLDSLKKQTMAPDDFEVMIADCYYDKRPEQDHIRDNTYRGVKYPFTIYHWQVKSPWLKRGLWTYQASFNQGIMLSDAEMLCLFGDCCEPIPEYLERMWAWHKKGYFAMGLVIYKINNVLALKNQIAEGNFIKHNRDWDAHHVIRDSRWVFVENAPDGVYTPIGFHSAQSFHGYASMPIEAALKINGFDENMDGTRGVHDIDTGIRLMHAGYIEKVVLDKNIHIFENRHENVPKSVLSYEGPPIRSNYSLMMLNNEAKRIRSNSQTLSDSDLDWMWNSHTTNETRAKTYDYRQNTHYQWWVKHQPIFDILDLRKKVQDNLKKGIVEIPEYYEVE